MRASSPTTTTASGTGWSTTASMLGVRAGGAPRLRHARVRRARASDVRRWASTCRGIGGSASASIARETDADHLDPDEIVQTIVDVVAHDGNLLLNVGPTANGEDAVPRRRRASSPSAVAARQRRSDLRHPSGRARRGHDGRRSAGALHRPRHDDLRDRAGHAAGANRRARRAPGSRFVGPPPRRQRPTPSGRQPTTVAASHCAPPPRAPRGRRSPSVSSRPPADRLGACFPGPRPQERGVRQPAPGRGWRTCAREPGGLDGDDRLRPRGRA